MIIDSIRWKLFKVLTALAWWVIPKPHKNDLLLGWDIARTEYLGTLAAGETAHAAQQVNNPENHELRQRRTRQ